MDRSGGTDGVKGIGEGEQASTSEGVGEEREQSSTSGRPRAVEENDIDVNIAM
jgi:hypothetical protein